MGLATEVVPATGAIGIGDELGELHATVRRWVQGHVDRVATRSMLDGDVVDVGRPAFWDDLRDQGWLGLHIAEAHGGEGFGLAELVVVLEELGRACAPGPFLPSVITSTVLQAVGSDDQRGELLPGLASGAEVGAIAIPPGDVVGFAALDGVTGADGSITISGTLRPVLGAGFADLLVVPARNRLADPADDSDNGSGSGHDDAAVVWCLLDRGQPGVDVRALPSVDGTRPVAEVVVDSVVVATTRQICAPVTAMVVADVAATLAGAESVGAAAWCVDTAAAHARERVQFGRPIGQFQAVKHRCANMLLTLEKARAATWDAASTPADVRERELAACVAGAVVADASFEIAKDCIQVLGGIGYTWEHDAHLYIKRATSMRQLLGPPSAWRARIAALGLDGVRRTLRVELPPDAETMRDEVRAFVVETQAKDKTEWTRAIADAGYLVPYWPKPWGREADPLEQLVIDDEFDRARLRRPHLQVGAWVLPTLIAYGTPEQQERWIRPTLHGKILWCQLFSEPEAGSDLASLRTKAVRDDQRGGWVVTGQKVWTTMANMSNWGILLARTDPVAPRHEGITCFILDMSAPGIDVRPLRELTGAEMFNEVFFTDVFVPDDCVVGAVDHGWEAARTTLANERVSMGSGSSFGPGVESVLELVRSRGLEADPIVCDAVGGLLATAQSIAVMGLRMTLRALAGAKPGPEASVRKLLATEHEQAVQEIGLALLGPDAAATDGAAAAWINGFLGNRALSIAGGTSDIQRNVVAERLLGLPKDPEPGS